MPWVGDFLKIKNRREDIYQKPESTCHVESPTNLFQWFLALKAVGPTQNRTINMLVKTSVLQVLHFVRLLIHQSKPVCCQSYYLKEYQYTSQNHCIVSPTLYRNIDTLVEIRVLLVVLFVGPSIQQSKSACHQSYFFVGLPIQQSATMYRQLYSSQVSGYGDQK